MIDLEQSEGEERELSELDESVYDEPAQDLFSHEEPSDSLTLPDISQQDLPQRDSYPDDATMEEAPMSEEAPVDEAPSERSVARGVRNVANTRIPREIRSESRKTPRIRQNPNIFRHIVTVSWSGAREPVDDMFWAEADSDGAWIVVKEFEKIRTRKEVLDRIKEIDASPEKPCLVSFDFNFSYPAQFFDLLKDKDHIADWRGMIAQVREDLKKNMDDGLRLWVERLGRYRESKLEPPRAPDERERGRSKRFEDWGWDFERKGQAPHEQRSLAERYRRTDFPLRIPAGASLMSTMNIAYNRLTGRYEFNGNEKRGRAAVAGMSMLDRILDARPHDSAVWPMSLPKPLTIVEVLPWLYNDGQILEAKKLNELLQNYEDFGWEIPQNARDMAAKNLDAQRALMTLLGMIKTELRSDHRRRPIRDYDRSMYDDPQIKLEGWIYGLGYRPRSESEMNAEENHTENLPEPDSNKPARKSRKKIASKEDESLVITEV